MAYKVIILYQLYMPSYFLGTFTEYPLLKLISVFKECTDRSVVGLFTAEWAFLSLIARFLF